MFKFSLTVFVFFSPVLFSLSIAHAETDLPKNAKIVPYSTLPNEQEMVIEEQIFSEPLTNYSRIFKDNNTTFSLFKRLNIPIQPDDEVRMVPDNSKELDVLVKCNSIKEINKNEYKDIIIYLNNNTGMVTARYPLEYRCSFDKNKIRESIHKSSELYFNQLQINQCDGRQITGYVDASITYGSGVLNIANNPSWGARAVSMALNSDLMTNYLLNIYDMRKHDLYLSRSGCKSLKNGPTQQEINRLKKVTSDIEKLSTKQATSEGLITGPNGVLK
ncbi:TPA: hypothetical protein ACTM63_004157 [Yersinia enterocolitica]|nr:hypothetical protein [Yersinia enterocolitica]HEP1966013.1 hypothetical protein [Yersinia enterocolitica]